MQQERKFDKNTIIGMVLMAVLFIGYFYLNQPSEEELKEIERQEQLSDQNIEKQKDSLIAVQQEKNDTIQKDSIRQNLTAKDFSTENRKFKIKFSGKGGYI